MKAYLIAPKENTLSTDSALILDVVGIVELPTLNLPTNAAIQFLPKRDLSTLKSSLRWVLTQSAPTN